MRCRIIGSVEMKTEERTRAGNFGGNKGSAINLSVLVVLLCPVVPGIVSLVHAIDYVGGLHLD